jgi:ubiquinone/menaquinone biosynthesis C-methylase UbiE
MEILDVGCGSKPKGDVNVDLLVENDEWKRKVDPKRIPNFIKADAHHLPFKDKAFKTTIMNHTLEHLRDPILAISEIARVTRDEMKVTVPNLFQFLADCVRPRKLLWISKHHKKKLFTKALLHQLLQNEGLVEVRNKLLEYEIRVRLNRL